MPELPDIRLYEARLRECLLGETCQAIGIWSLFVLRSYETDPKSLVGRTVTDVGRVGKRLVIEFGGPAMVIHLMIAGRFLWAPGQSPFGRPKNRDILWSAQFGTGTLSVTEMSKKKRSSLHVVADRDQAHALGRGGAPLADLSDAEFAEIMQQENRTLKRALANPAWLDGIGNAYSDEILHAARLSPLKLTRSCTGPELSRLREAGVRLLDAWTEKLASEIKSFPKPSQITAFRPDFAVHGKFGQPCPECGVLVQRVVYAENETNYCPRCQNEDRVLADRALSRLLKDDWPRTVEELLGEE